MAFTEAQRAKIRFALGYPDVFRQYNPRLEGALDVIGTRPDTQALVEQTLASIDAVSTSIASSLTSAGIKRAEDIEWFGSATGGSAVINQKKVEGRTYCGRLSIILGVPLAGDIFGTGGYAGDGWSGIRAQNGGPIPIG